MISSNEKNGETNAVEDCAYDSNHRLTQPHRGEVMFLFFFINKKMLNDVHTANVWIEYKLENGGNLNLGNSSLSDNDTEERRKENMNRSLLSIFVH